MGIRIFKVDAFTASPFSGNPAAVCMLTEPRDARWMRDIAREMNVSETAFLKNECEGYGLRWFTPAAEVDLCGHATLASAHILFEEGYIRPDKEALFYTKSGILTARQRPPAPDEKTPWLELDFPAEPEESAACPSEISLALGAKFKYVGRSRFDYLVEVASEEIVRDLRPDFSILKRLSCRGIIVTSLSASKDYDFVSRFFAPGIGIEEDPVTGSAHCTLGPFWKKHLHKDDFIGYQASERGGVVHVSLSGDRVRLRGQAVTILRGELQT